jgi:hypothetical protein
MRFTILVFRWIAVLIFLNFTIRNLNGCQTTSEVDPEIRARCEVMCVW